MIKQRDNEQGRKAPTPVADVIIAKHSANSAFTFEDFKTSELISIAVAYTGITKSTFGIAGSKTERVKKLINENPHSCPFNVPSLVTTILTRVRSRKVEALDVTPAVAGRSFVTVADEQTCVSTVYTRRSCLEKLREADPDKPCPLSDRTHKPTARLAFGVATEKKGAEHARRQRVAAICDAMLVPDTSRKSYKAAITVAPSKARHESLMSPSSVAAGFFADVRNLNLKSHGIYDAMMTSDPAYKAYASAIGHALEPTAYKASANEDTGVLEEVCYPPAQRREAAPIAMICDLATAIQPGGIGKLTRHMFDGVLLSGGLRKKMNKIADITVPDDVSEVYLESPDAELAKCIVRKYSDRKLVVFYKTGEYQVNVKAHEECLSILENGTVEVSKSGALAWFGQFEPYNKSKSMYIDMTKVTAPSVTQKKLSEGCRTVMEKEAYKFRVKPDMKYYLMLTHVYALDPDLYVDGAKDLPAYPGKFKIARNFQGLNIWTTNIEDPYVTLFSRTEILQVFVHVLRWAMAYPISRAPLLTYLVNKEMVPIVSWWSYYPFSPKADLEEIINRDARKRRVVDTQVTYQTTDGGVVQTTVPQEAPRTTRIVPPPSRRRRIVDDSGGVADKKAVDAVKQALVNAVAPAGDDDYVDTSSDEESDEMD